MSIPELKDYSPTKISLTKPKKNKNGKGESQYINTEEYKELGNGNVVFEIQNAIVQYTIKPYDPEADPASQGLKLHIRKDENNPSVMKVFETIEQLENEFGKKMDENSKEWFFKQRKEGQSYAKISSCISEHLNKKEPNNPYPDTLRVSVPFDYEAPYKVKNFFDATNFQEMKLVHSNQGNSDYIPIGDKILNGSSGNFVIKMSNIWHSSGNWGIKLSVIRAVVKCMSYGGGSLNLPPLTAPTIEPVKTQTSNEENDNTIKMDDEEEGEMVEAEEEVEVPKKTRGRKKIDI